MGRAIILIILLSFSELVCGQKLYNELHIGDTLPSLVISKTLNDGKSILNTDIYRDKLLIIDFWHSGCTVCIEAMPELDLLQKKFGNAIKILPVTFEKSEYIKSFWQKNKYTKQTSLPTVVEDKVFSALFPHISYPHDVWVYNNKVIAITHGFYVTDQNVQILLKTGKLSLPLKYDFYNFDRTKPLFLTDSSQIDTHNTFFQYIAISDFKEKVNSEGGSGGAGIIHDVLHNVVRTYFINQPILNSYFYYWRQLLGSSALRKPSIDLQENQIVWNVKNKARYRYKKGAVNSWDWLLENSICFESVRRDTGQTDLQIYSQAISDLDNLLGLSVKWKSKFESVYFIKKTDAVKNDHLPLKKSTLNQLVYKFNNIEGNPYLFNMEVDGDMAMPDLVEKDLNILELSKTLMYYGLQIVEEKRDVDHLYFDEVADVAFNKKT